MDKLVDILYDGSRVFEMIWLFYQDLMMRNFPHGATICVGAHSVLATLNVYAAQKGKPPLYWLHSLVTVVLACFGGGIIAPMLYGQPPLPIANDVLLPMVTVLWYSVFHLGAASILGSTPVKLVMNVFLAVFRTHSAVGVVSQGVSLLKPGPYYPTPVMGPIIAATVIGSFAPFLPFDKGLAAITKSTPWPMQSAFIGASFYLFMIKDQAGFIGQAMRAVFGNLSERTVILIIGTAHLFNLMMQFFFSADANIFTPFHKVMYLIFQVQGPIVTSDDAVAAAKKDNVGWSFGVRRSFEAFVDASRVLIILFAVLLYFYFNVPPATLPAVQLAAPAAVGSTVTLKAVSSSGLPLGGVLGVKQWVSFVPVKADAMKASPYALQLQEWHSCKDDACSAVANETSALSLLRAGSVKDVKYRLTVQQTVLSGKSSTVRWGAATYATGISDEAAISKNFTWMQLLPVKFSSAEQLEAVDAAYDAKRVALYVTTDGTFYLLSSAAPAGSLLDPAKISGKVLWTAQNKASCSAAAVAAGRSGDVKVAGLTLDAGSGFPVLKCTDGSVVDVNL